MLLAREFGETATAVNRVRTDEGEADVRWGCFAAVGIMVRKAGRMGEQKLWSRRGGKLDEDHRARRGGRETATS